MRRTVPIILFLALLVSGGQLVAESATFTRVVPLDKKEKTETAPPLQLQWPPLARLGAVDESGDTWRQDGEIEASFIAAREDLSRSLRRQGWVMIRQVPLSRQVRRQRELQSWQLGPRAILLMVWEVAAGKSGFCWGEDLGEKKTASSGR